GFFSSMWLRKALRRRMRPVPVTLKRLAAPRWVFILGISALLLLLGLGGDRLGLLGALGRSPGPLVGRQHHDHVAPVELGRSLDLCPTREVVPAAVDSRPAPLRLGHLSYSARY